MAPIRERIQRFGGPSASGYTYIPLVVIGAGESGVCVGAKLQYKLGFDQFRIFERRSCLGGTWFANSYPGLACDIPAICYSFSFAQNPKWTQLYPSGSEIVQYLYDVASKYKMLDKIQCDTNVKSIRWLEMEQQWELILEYLAKGVGDMSSAERAEYEKEHKVATVLREETVRAKVVVSAVGGLVEPKDPLDLPGKEDFQGAIMHTARWDNSIELKDKNIVVVGTGCSAAQVIPELIQPQIGAKHVTQLMRSPPWTVPAMPKDAQKSWRKWMPRLSVVPGVQKSIRKVIFSMFEIEWYQLFAANEASRERRLQKRDELLAHLYKTVPKEYHDILTPDYEVFCKRRIIDDGWFESLNDPRVDLSTQAPKALTKKGVVLSAGLVYPKSSGADKPEKEILCDVLVMANGYRTNEWLHPLKITGKKGVSLHDQWQQEGGAGAYLTLACHNFPNYFMLVGPNSVTGHSSVILASENASNYALNFIEPILRGDVSTYEVKQSAEKEWTEETQRTLSKSVYNTGGTTNWYVTDGWNSTMYPRSQIDYWVRCQLPRWGHWNAAYTNKGFFKLWARRLLFLATIVLAWKVGTQALPRLRAGEFQGVLQEWLSQARKLVDTVSAQGYKILNR